MIPQNKVLRIILLYNNNEISLMSLNHYPNSSGHIYKMPTIHSAVCILDDDSIMAVFNSASDRIAFSAMRFQYAGLHCNQFNILSILRLIWCSSMDRRH